VQPLAGRLRSVMMAGSRGRASAVAARTGGAPEKRDPGAAGLSWKCSGGTASSTPRWHASQHGVVLARQQFKEEPVVETTPNGFSRPGRRSTRATRVWRIWTGGFDLQA
jgi:hypothetical protein